MDEINHQFQRGLDTLVYDYEAGSAMISNALEWAQHVENDSLICVISLQYGTLLWAHSGYEPARKHLTTVIHLDLYPDKTAAALNTFGLSYFYQADYEQAVKYLDSALVKFQSINDSTGISRVLNNLGMVYQAKGEFKKATDLIVEGLRHKVRYIGLADQYYTSNNPLSLHMNSNVSEGLFEDLKLEIVRTKQQKNWIDLGRNYQKLGTIFLFQDELDSGLFYIKRSYRLHKSIGARSRLALDCIDLGDTFSKLKIQDSSTFYYQESLDYLSSEKMIPTLSSGYMKLAALYQKQKRYPEAELLLKKLYKLSDSVGHTAMVAKTGILLSDLYLQKEEPDRALSFAKEALNLASQAGSYKNRMNAHKALSNIYIRLDDMNSAYIQRELFHEMKARQAEAEIYQKAKEYEVQTELDKIRSNFNSLSEKQSFLSYLYERQKIFLYLSIIALSAFIVFILVLIKKNRTIERLNIENKIRGDQNELLLREVHHRVKNNLQMISSILALQLRGHGEIPNNRLEEAQIRIRSIAMIHEHLYQANQFDIIYMDQLIEKLVKLIQDSYKVKNIPKVTYQVDPIPLDIDQSTIIGLIFHELINNCYKYAFPDHPDPKLKLICTGDHKKLILQVHDNGFGSEKEPSEGFGWKIVKACLHRYEGKMDIVSINGFHVNIQMKLEN